jgi:hypothetical protein
LLLLAGECLYQRLDLILAQRLVRGGERLAQSHDL